MILYNIESSSIGSLDKNTTKGQNGLKAFEYAQRHYDDYDINNYAVINVEGYDSIAHKTGRLNETFDEIIFPFDKERLYPIQGLQLEYSFKRKW